MLGHELINRRRFIKAGSLTALALAAGAITGTAELTTEKLELSETKLVIPNLPKAFEVYRIGFISDLHLGVCVTSDLIHSAMSLVKQSKVDLLLLGGDYLYVAHTLRDLALEFRRNLEFVSAPASTLPELLFSRVADILSQVNAPDGMFAVYGNHDKWTSAKLCLKALSARNIRLLNNESVTISRGQERIILTGLDDYWTGIPRSPVYSEEARRGETRIVFCHNPDLFSNMLERNKVNFDVGLAGHTHGGQIVLPVLGAPRYNIRDLRFRAGLFTHGNTHFYTTRGVGLVAIPVRINCPPEVSILTLVKS